MAETQKNQNLGISSYSDKYPSNLNFGTFRQTLVYKIAEDCSVQLQFDGPVAREGIEKLITLLQTNADVFPRKAPVLATI